MAFETPNHETTPINTPETELVPDQIRDSVTDSTEKELSEHESQLTGSSLNTLKDISRSDALKLAIEELDLVEPIDTHITGEKIKSYQKSQGIDIDGKIGKQTYLALRASQAFKNASHKIEQHGISKTTQKDISFVLSHPGISTDYLALTVLLQDFEGKQKDNPKYTDFLKETKTLLKKQENNKNHPARIELHKKDKNGNSPGWDIAKAIEWELEWSDVLKRNKWTAIIAGLIGFVFFGGEIKGLNKIPGTGSIFGRIAWLIGGAILGGDDLIGYGIDKAIAKAEWTDTTGFGKWFKNGQKAVTEAAQSLESELAPGSWTDATSNFFKESYQTLLGSISTSNETFKNATDPADKAKYIPETAFQVLWENVLGNKEFMKIPKDSLKNIDSIASLVTYLPADIAKKLQKSGATDKDIKNFLTLYVLPEIHSEESSFWENWMWKVQDLNNAAQGSLKWEYIANKKLNDIIVTEISTLTQTGTPKVQEQARNMQTAILQGKIQDFQLKLDGFSITEKTSLETTLQKIQGIEKSEAAVIHHIGKISAIRLLSKWQLEKENEQTLTHKLEELFKLQKAPDIASNTGTHPSDYNLERVTEAFEGKKYEILTMMSSLGIVAYNVEWSSVDIKKELQKSEDLKKLSEDQNTVQEIREKIGEVPTSESTALKMRDWYDTSSTSFTQLTKIQDSTNNKELQNKIETILKKRDIFVDNYKIVRQKTQNEMKEFTNELDNLANKSVESSSEFAARKEEILRIVEKINSTLAGITSENGIHIKSFWKDLFSNDYKRFTSARQANAIYALDEELKLKDLSDLGIVTLIAKIRTTVRSIEENFSVDVWVDDIDISKEETLARTIEKLGRLSSVTTRGILTFANPDVLESKKQKIKTQVQDINMAFIHAINSSTSGSELWDIESKYRVYFEGKFSNTWQDIKTAVGMEDDPVRVAYERKKEEFEKTVLEENRKDIISKNAWDDSVTHIVNPIVTFLKKNADTSKDIKSIYTRLGGAKTVLLSDVLNALELINKTKWVQDVIDTAYKQIDSIK